ncbi:cytochrome c oxidase subunit 3 [Novosphingobium lentum]|uniref:cytochrome c oxidase subunit 3 n=1 Tax=Novosphingobium lentum TaxID=145287 RepID=UPI00082B842A|nr:cytochrome c oxidase subunit 3 [Novosphingobium lentum]
MDAALAPYRYWRFCLWSGPIFLVALALFWGVIAHSFPPFAPTIPATVVAAWFVSDGNSIRIGMLGAMTFVPFYIIWGVGLSKLMETLEGGNRVLSQFQMWGAGLTAVAFMIAFMIMVFGAYRAEALDPLTLQFMYDTGWVMLLVPYAGVLIQQIPFGVLLLSDRRAEPLMPRWVCWYSIWIGFGSLIEFAMPFFRIGVFARDGLVNFWVEANIYFFWIVLLSFYGLKALNRLEREALAGTTGPVPERLAATTDRDRGFWAFIFADMIVFAVLFTAFSIDRWRDPVAFQAGHAALDATRGLAETVLLLLGSGLVVVALSAARSGAIVRVVPLLGGALATSLAFCGLKALEYRERFAAGQGPDSQLFFSHYFAMTGLHLSHVVLSILAVGWIAWRYRRGDASSALLRMFGSAAIFWHMVDLLWVILFATLYLGSAA